MVYCGLGPRWWGALRIEDWTGCRMALVGLLVMGLLRNRWRLLVGGLRGDEVWPLRVVIWLSFGILMCRRRRAMVVYCVLRRYFDILTIALPCLMIMRP